MRSSLSALRIRHLFPSSLGLLFCLHPFTDARAAVRQVWAQHWNGGFPAKANQAVDMQLDSAGNICVIGSAANSSNLLDYATFKYAPDGTLLWSKRYGTTNGLSNVPRAMALDTNDNVYITGTSVTVKYSSAGAELWTAPYGGRALSVQGTNFFVAGYSETKFVTAKLGTDGSTLWTRSFHDSAQGTQMSQGVKANADGDVFVAGSISTFFDKFGGYKGVTLVKYSTDGTELFSSYPITPWQGGFFANFSMKLNDLGHVFLSYTGLAGWYLASFDSVGNLRKGGIYNTVLNPTSMDISGDASVETCSYNSVMATINVWGAPNQYTFFPSGPNATSGSGLAIVADKQGGNVSVGYVSDGLHPSDLAVMHCDNVGNVVMTTKYNGTADGTDAGTAVTLSSSGDIYVAGYSTLTQGGTEIILLKYSEHDPIQKSSEGVVLQFPGSVGQQYKIQATASLPNWTDIGVATTTPEGWVNFTDTNSTQYPFRFYQTVTTAP